jgi:hypothetical protein
MIDIGFEWPRGLKYECIEEDGTRMIRQVEVPGVKKQTQLAEPLKHTTTPLYKRFAELDGSADACVEFAMACGLLKTKASIGASERLDGWQREIKKLRALMTVLSAADEQPGGFVRTANSRRVRLKMTNIDVALLSGPSEPLGGVSRPALVLQPQNLLDAMYLQLAKFVAGDGVLRPCKQCGKWFECGATEARRSLALFCSPQCKDRFHYLRRKAS